MSDPRNAAHDKKVNQEKKHHSSQVLEDPPVVQPEASVSLIDAYKAECDRLQGDSA